MSEIRRFRVNLPDHMSARLNLGDRYACDPEWITEEWDLSTGGGKSFLPRKVNATKPRAGILVKHAVEGGKAAVFEDVHPLWSSPGAILSALGPRLLCDPDALKRLLDHCALRRTPMREDDYAAVANAVAPWLRQTFPDLAKALNRVPDWGTGPGAVALYGAWLDGVEAVVGSSVLVPAPPFNLTRTLNMSKHLWVRSDAVERLARDRSN